MNLEILHIIILACKINIASNVLMDQIQRKEAVCRAKVLKCVKSNALEKCLTERD